MRLTFDAAGDALLERLTAAAVETWRLGPTCGAEMLFRRERPMPDHGLTDAALAARLARGDTGVILLWSPHMPLSVDQHDVLVAVTRKLGIALVTVLDPAADPGYAHAVAVERRLPPSTLEPLTGIELAFRGMTTHAPSVQVFTGGRLTGSVLFGFRGETTARLAIEEILADATSSPRHTPR